MTKIIAIILAISAVFFYIYRTSTNKASAKENIQLGEAFLAANRATNGVKITDSGLQYLVLRAGTGAQHPAASDRVKVHYHGTLIDGTVFDSSVDRGQPIEFSLNQVIKGWTEGLQLMVVGEKTRLFIPSTLAYGNRQTGAIRAGSTLVYDVELLAINE